ncbi:hypothetical protein [Bradyrhizobium sp. 6(2017)]|uniref:hypothetical protein n=1 Tax=Bradyrhizobium sp. 6(2017) TaxID=1197460 RepID=UPI0013E0F25F|nr:hypothetical protein [Bradyrhizobium sp. 6(2017)]QIG95935.1 hypothetical protein G6P99_28400 [Bradyrhizobium sp. 6(2017)]
MTRLIAVTGYSGAGKTTAIELIAKLCPSAVLYVGQLVGDEILRRQLPPGPESERTVRLELRKEYAYDEDRVMDACARVRRAL